MIQKLELTNVYQRTVEAVEKGYDTICHEGGSRSGKTWSIFFFFILKAMAGEVFKLTIVRSKLTWVKDSLLVDFEEICRTYNYPVTPDVNPNRPEQRYQINGATFIFIGLDDNKKVHGQKRTYLWANEVMEINKKDYDQLEMRTESLKITDYNPSDDSHWVFGLHKRDNVKVIHSTLLDNEKFLAQPIIDKIRSYEPTQENIEQGTADNYMWEVYGLGKKARLEGVIFTNWDIVEKIPEDATFLGYGQDYGYTNDPTTLVALYRMNNELYLDELLYETGMLSQDTINKLKELGITRNDLIIGDSEDPRYIEEIRRGGFYIKGAEKGQDSVRIGIDLLKGYKIHITKRSDNLESELRKYKWAEDKTGKSLNVPVDANNHLIDASRYIARACLTVPKRRVFTSKPHGF
jgi:phage terminase large subunit